MNLQQRIKIMTRLGELLQNRTSDSWQAVFHKAYVYNKWFTTENLDKALDSLSNQFLAEAKLREWLQRYDIPENPKEIKRVAIVMAGNIPLVGFHDMLCVFMSGHKVMMKLSEKDNVLLPYLLELLKEIDPETSAYFEVAERFANFDGVIATGSDNSSRYFEAYFGKYPNIIRKNRNAVAVLNGNESEEELKALGDDVFQYFGLGCRNVSKVYLPEDYDFKKILTGLHEYREIQHHDKYKNNFDYNYTMLILNQVPHQANGCILMKEDKAITSRIANLHYEYYKNKEELDSELEEHKDRIQCIVAQDSFLERPTVSFGKAQQPALYDYADGVDTMAFLLGL